MQFVDEFSMEKTIQAKNVESIKKTRVFQKDRVLSTLRLHGIVH